MGFSGGSDGKESACNVGDPGSIPGSERSLGKGNGNPLQYFCLKNSTDRGVWWASVHGVAKSRTWLNKSQHTHTHTHKQYDYKCRVCIDYTVNEWHMKMTWRLIVSNNLRNIN